MSNNTPESSSNSEASQAKFKAVRENAEDLKRLNNERIEILLRGGLIEMEMFVERIKDALKSPKDGKVAFQPQGDDVKEKSEFKLDEADAFIMQNIAEGNVEYLKGDREGRKKSLIKYLRAILLEYCLYKSEDESDGEDKSPYPIIQLQSRGIQSRDIQSRDIKEEELYGKNITAADSVEINEEMTGNADFIRHFYREDRNPRFFHEIENSLGRRIYGESVGDREAMLDYFWQRFRQEQDQTSQKKVESKLRESTSLFDEYIFPPSSMANIGKELTLENIWDNFESILIFLEILLKMETELGKKTEICLLMYEFLRHLCYRVKNIAGLKKIQREIIFILRGVKSVEENSEKSKEFLFNSLKELPFNEEIRRRLKSFLHLVSGNIPFLDMTGKTDKKEESASENNATILWHYSQSITFAKRSALLHNSRGYILSVMGRNNDARDAFLQALALDPFNPKTYNNLGYLHMMKEEFDRGINYYLGALRICKNRRKIIDQRKELFPQFIKKTYQTLVAEAHYDKALTEYAKATFHNPYLFVRSSVLQIEDELEFSELNDVLVSLVYYFYSLEDSIKAYLENKKETDRQKSVKDRDTYLNNIGKTLHVIGKIFFRIRDEMSPAGIALRELMINNNTFNLLYSCLSRINKEINSEYASRKIQDADKKFSILIKELYMCAIALLNSKENRWLRFTHLENTYAAEKNCNELLRNILISNTIAIWFFMIMNSSERMTVQRSLLYSFNYARLYVDSLLIYKQYSEKLLNMSIRNKWIKIIYPFATAKSFDLKIMIEDFLKLLREPQNLGTDLMSEYERTVFYHDFPQFLDDFRTKICNWIEKNKVEIENLENKYIKREKEEFAKKTQKTRTPLLQPTSSDIEGDGLLAKVKEIENLNEELKEIKFSLDNFLRRLACDTDVYQKLAGTFRHETDFKDLYLYQQRVMRLLRFDKTDFSNQEVSQYQSVSAFETRIGISKNYSKTTEIKEVETPRENLEPPTTSYKKVYTNEKDTSKQIDAEVATGALRTHKKSGANAQITLYDTVGLNDRKEGLAFLDWLGITYEKPDTYLVLQSSFNGNPDDLTMFRLYGKTFPQEAARLKDRHDNGEGTGVCIVVDERFFNRVFMEILLLRRIPHPGEVWRDYWKVSQGLLSLESRNGVGFVGGNSNHIGDYLTLYNVIYYDVHEDKFIYHPANYERSLNPSKKKDSPKEGAVPIAKRIEKRADAIEEELKKIKNIVDRIKLSNDRAKINACANLLVYLRHLVKHEGFTDERELRILMLKEYGNVKITVRDEEYISLGCNYLSILEPNHPITKVVLGPKVKHGRARMFRWKQHLAEYYLKESEAIRDEFLREIVGDVSDSARNDFCTEPNKADFPQIEIIQSTQPLA